MKTIVFLSPYPYLDRIKEGMMQRIKAIDNIFNNEYFRKIYLQIEYKKLINVSDKRGNVLIKKLSLLTSFIKIINILKSADLIYIQSLYGIGVAGFFILPFINNKKIVWDVHGIIPEELSFQKASKTKIFVYSKLERYLSKKATRIVVVTNRMAKHLMKKYSWISTYRFILYPILPEATVKGEIFFNNKNENILCLYSGNTQLYQNVDLMLKCIKNKNQENIEYIILTGQPEIFQKKIENLGIDKLIKVLSVKSSELPTYYSKANYGFILREDIPLNNVACPTKISEYLAFGMIPIVLSTKIGDFVDMNMDFITIDEFLNNEIIASKSDRNRKIFEDLQKICAPEQFLENILERGK